MPLSATDRTTDSRASRLGPIPDPLDAPGFDRRDLDGFIAFGPPARRPPRVPRRPLSRWIDPRHLDPSLLWLLPVGLLALLTVSWWVARAPGGGTSLAVGQWAGLASAVAAVTAVALMARLPVMTRTLGADTIRSWHRSAGIATTAGLVVHALGITFGRAAIDGRTPIAQASTMISRYPGVPAATVAALVLLAIGVSSVPALRARMGHEAWRALHWCSYPAVALAFAHQVTIGSTFAASPVLSWGWTWLHLFVAGLVVWYRLALPAWLMVRHPLQVGAVTTTGPDTVSIVLSGEHLDDYDAHAGQHIRMRVLTPQSRWRSHPFSFSARPTDTQWRISVVAAGDDTRRLQQIEPGTKVVVSGAYGHLTAARRTRPRVALIGSGTGMAPLRALLESLPLGVDVTVVCFARSRLEILHGGEIDRLIDERSGRVVLVGGLPIGATADSSTDPLSAEELREAVPDMSHRDVYVAGPGPVVRRVLRSLRALDVPPERIHTERHDG